MGGWRQSIPKELLLGRGGQDAEEGSYGVCRSMRGVTAEGDRCQTWPQMVLGREGMALTGTELWGGGREHLPQSNGPHRRWDCQQTDGTLSGSLCRGHTSGKAGEQMDPLLQGGENQVGQTNPLPKDMKHGFSVKVTCQQPP